MPALSFYWHYHLLFYCLSKLIQKLLLVSTPTLPYTPGKSMSLLATLSTHILFLSSLSYHTFVLYSFLPITYCGSTLPIYISISLPLTPPISLYQYNAVPFQPNLFIFSLYLLIIQFYSHFSENGITLASHHHLHAYLCPPLCHILVTRLSINITSFLLSHQTYKSWIMHSCHKAQTSIIPMQYNQGY